MKYFMMLLCLPLLVIGLSGAEPEEAQPTNAEIIAAYVRPSVEMVPELGAIEFMGHIRILKAQREIAKEEFASKHRPPTPFGNEGTGLMQSLQQTIVDNIQNIHEHENGLKVVRRKLDGTVTYAPRYGAGNERLRDVANDKQRTRTNIRNPVMQEVGDLVEVIKKERDSSLATIDIINKVLNREGALASRPPPDENEKERQGRVKAQHQADVERLNADIAFIEAGLNLVKDDE